MRNRDWRNNRYWRRVGGSGHICDHCQDIGNFLATVEHRETGVRLCMSLCYDNRKQALKTVLAGRAKETMSAEEKQLREVFRAYDTAGEWFHVQVWLAGQLEKLGEEEFKRIAREEGVPEQELV